MENRAFAVSLLVLLNLLTHSPGGLAATGDPDISTTTGAFKEVMNKSSLSFQILTVDWMYVHVPYLVTLWILIAFGSLIEPVDVILKIKKRGGTKKRVTGDCSAT